MTDMQGKTGLIVGVANKRSIAWAIAKAASDAGARLAFTYQGDKLKEKVEELVKTLPAGAPMYPCAVTSDDHVARVGGPLERDLGGLDFLVHSTAFAERQDLEGTSLAT